MHDGMEGASCMSERRRAVRPKRGRERAASDDSRREDRANRRHGRRSQDTPPSALKERDGRSALRDGEKDRDSPPSQLRIKAANVPVSRDILEHMVPGVTGGLTPDEIEQLKDISAKLPGWNTEAMRRVAAKMTLSEAPDGASTKKERIAPGPMAPHHDTSHIQQQQAPMVPANTEGVPPSMKSSGENVVGIPIEKLKVRRVIKVRHASTQSESAPFSAAMQEANRFERLKWDDFSNTSENEVAGGEGSSIPGSVRGRGRVSGMASSESRKEKEDVIHARSSRADSCEGAPVLTDKHGNKIPPKSTPPMRTEENPSLLSYWQGEARGGEMKPKGGPVMPFDRSAGKGYGVTKSGKGTLGRLFGILNPEPYRQVSKGPEGKASWESEKGKGVGGQVNWRDFLHTKGGSKDSSGHEGKQRIVQPLTTPKASRIDKNKGKGKQQGGPSSSQGGGDGGFQIVSDHVNPLYPRHIPPDRQLNPLDSKGRRDLKDGECEGCTGDRSLQLHKELFNPPEDVYEKTDKYKLCDSDVRNYTAYLLQHNKDMLRQSLRLWILAGMKGAPQMRPLSTKRLNHIIYCQRGLLLREFVTLCGADDLTEAVRILTGVDVGHLKGRRREGLPEKPGFSQKEMAQKPDSAHEQESVRGKRGEKGKGSFQGGKGATKGKAGKSRNINTGVNTSLEVLAASVSKLPRDTQYPKEGKGENNEGQANAPGYKSGAARESECGVHGGSLPPPDTNKHAGCGDNKGETMSSLHKEVSKDMNLPPAVPVCGSGRDGRAADECSPSLQGDAMQKKLQDGGKRWNVGLLGSSSVPKFPESRNVGAEGRGEDAGMRRNDPVIGEKHSGEALRTRALSGSPPSSLRGGLGMPCPSGVLELHSAPRAQQPDRDKNEMTAGDCLDEKLDRGICGDMRCVDTDANSLMFSGPDRRERKEEMERGVESCSSPRETPSIVTAVQSDQKDLEQPESVLLEGDREDLSDGLQHGLCKEVPMGGARGPDLTHLVAVDCSVADRLIIALREEVTLESIAVLQGMDMAQLREAAGAEGSQVEQRSAKMDISVLEGIQRYLSEQRTKVIKWDGNHFVITLRRLPCRILSTEKTRYDELFRSNHKRAHSYTDYRKGGIYRCPLPGREGATLNYGNIKRALSAHNKAYHKAWLGLKLAYKIEMGRGWDYLNFDTPQDNAKMNLRGKSMELVSSQSTSQDEPGGTIINQSNNAGCGVAPVLPLQEAAGGLELRGWVCQGWGREQINKRDKKHGAQKNETDAGKAVKFASGPDLRTVQLEQESGHFPN